METVKNQCLPGAVWGWMNRWSAEDFQDGENTLYDTVVMGKNHYAIVPAHRMYNTKSEP